MDLDSFQEDLHALRKLYRLVKINGSGDCTALSETLDEGSRVFLRKLLDAAAERVFKAHIKITTDNWRSLLGTKCLGQLENPKETERSQTSIPSYAAKSNDFDENIKESVGELLLKDEQTLESRMPGKVASVTSRLRRSATEIQSRNKHFLVGKEDSNFEQANEKAPTQASALSILDQGLDVQRSLESVKNSGMLGNKMGCNTTPWNQMKDKPSNVEDFSKEVDDAIRRIESLVPSLHRLAKPVRSPSRKKMGNPDSLKKTNPVLDLDVIDSSSGLNSGGGVLTKTKGGPTRQEYQELGNCNKFSPKLIYPQQMSDYESSKEGQLEEELEMLKNATSEAHINLKTRQLARDTTCGQDYLCKDHELLEESMSQFQGQFRSTKGKEIQRTSESSRPNSKAILQDVGTLYGSQIDNVGQTANNIQGMKILPSQFNDENVNQYRSCPREVRRKTLASSSTSLVKSRERFDMPNSVHRGKQVQSRVSVLPSRRKTGSQESSSRSPKDNSLSRFNESDATYSDSPGSSSWTTVIVSSSYSPSSTIPSSSSYSDENEDSGFSGSGPNSQDVVFESSGTRYITSQSSSSYGASSKSSPDYEGDLSPSEYYQSSHHSVRNRGESGFKRLKNKLGLIFHHHHHHHHHHHNNKSDHATGSVWNQVGKMFKNTEKGKLKKADNSRKGKHLAKSGTRKVQTGNLHTLVEGLMRHVKHSKKSKKAKGSVGKLGGQNKDGKNRSWLQNLGAQGGKVKVPNKARAKLQGRDKKPRLTAPKPHVRHS